MSTNVADAQTPVGNLALCADLRQRFFNDDRCIVEGHKHRSETIR